MADDIIDSDPVFGGSHHEPAEDPIIGGQQQQGEAAVRQYLNRSWPSLAAVDKQEPPPSQTPIRDLARNAVAAATRGATSGLDLITNPSQAVLHPLMVAGATGYDWLAPKIGLPQMTPGQRADITGYGAPPEQGGNVAALVNAAGQATGNNPYAVVPKTPLEARTATAIEGAVPALGLGGLSRLGAARGGLLGGLGAEGGAEAAENAPDWLKPGIQTALNMLIQGGGAAVTGRPGSSIDPSVARIAQTGRAEGIPFTAPDITPNSPFRSPQSVARTSDALQGNMIRELGANPNTGDPVTTNRVTPDVTNQGRRTAGNDIEAITNNNNVGPMQSYRLLQQLQAAERQIDTTAGVTDADRTQMRARIAEIRGAINRNTGQMTGGDYHSLTQTDSPLDRLTGNANSDMATIGRGLMTNLDQAFRSSLSPDDAAAHTNARYRYRLASTLRPLADKYQGQALPPGEVADALYGAQQRYGSTPGSQLDRFMSQARLIAGGPTPQGGGSIVDPLLTPQGVMAATGSHPAVAIPAMLVQGAIDKTVGPYARSKYRAGQLIDAATSPPMTPLQRALAALTSASIP